jgi:mono/diheme cytochrome c family protein
MKRILGIAFLVAGATFFASALSGKGVRSGTQGATRPESTPELVAEGKRLYGEYCVTCHGDTGKGDGEAAYLLLPSPRDFSEGKFNRRNTPPRNLPSDDDLFKAISGGLLGSAMPPWKDYLTENERWGLVEYLKKELIALYDEDTEEMVSLYELTPPEAPLPVPEPVPATPENVAIGRGIYHSVAECWTCHGRSGSGDGPQAAEIENTMGERIYPPDLTKGIYKLSSDNEELFRRIREGITLAPMFSMAETLTDQEVWCLVHYVRSLVNRSEEERKMNEQYRREISVSEIEGALPQSPDDNAWNGISSQYIPLMPLWQQMGERVEGLFVKAVHDGKAMAIQLAWTDDTEDVFVIRHEGFRDGAAIQLSADKSPPLFAMGQKDRPVNIWHWKSDWEADLAGYKDVDVQYPNMVSDDYQFVRDAPLGEHGQEKLPISKHDPIYLTGWGAGNLLSNPDRKGAVEDLNAVGLGTLTSQGVAAQGVKGTGRWHKGMWRVVFTRDLSSNGKADVMFAKGSSVNIAFAAWNGSQNERDGQKQVSIWHELVIK